MLVLDMGRGRIDSIALEARVLCCLFAIEGDADLLERDGLRLRVCEVDHEDFEDDDGAYDDEVSGAH
jgi:hypothetical protein